MEPKTRFSYPGICIHNTLSKEPPNKPTCDLVSALCQKQNFPLCPCKYGRETPSWRLPHLPLFSYSEPKGRLCVLAPALDPPANQRLNQKRISSGHRGGKVSGWKYSHLLVTGLREFLECFFQLGLMLLKEAILLPQLFLQQRASFLICAKAKHIKHFSFCDTISILGKQRLRGMVLSSNYTQKTSHTTAVLHSTKDSWGSKEKGNYHLQRDHYMLSMLDIQVRTELKFPHS